MTPISFFAWSHQRSHHKKAQKRHPHHHRNHVVSTSTAAAALSSAKVLMSHGNTALPRHAPGLHYHANLMASAITSSSAAVTRPGTRLPSPTTAQSQDRSSPTCTSPSQLVAFRATYFIPSSPEDNDLVANQAHQLLICKSTSTHHDVITTINWYGKQLHNHLYPCLILIFICL